MLIIYSILVWEIFAGLKLAKSYVYSYYGKWPTNSKEKISDFTVMMDLNNCNGRKVDFATKK